MEFFHPGVMEEFLKTNPGFEELVLQREIQVEELARATDPSGDSASYNTAPGSPVASTSHDSDLIDLNATTETINIDTNILDLTNNEEPKKKRGRGRPRSRQSTGTLAATSSVNGHDSPQRSRNTGRPIKRLEEWKNKFSGTITDPLVMLEYVKLAPANEVFASSHADSNYPSTMARKCVVDHVSHVQDNEMFDKQPSHYFYRKYFDQTKCELRDAEEHEKITTKDMARKSYRHVNMTYTRPSQGQQPPRFTASGDTVSEINSDEIKHAPQTDHSKSGPPLKRRKLDNNHEDVQQEKNERDEGHEQHVNGNHIVNTAVATGTSAGRVLKTSVNGERSESSEGEPTRKASGPGRGRKRKAPEPSSPEYMESLRIEYNCNAGANNNNTVPIKHTLHSSTIDMILDDEYQGSSEVLMLERAVGKVHEAVDVSRHALESFKKQIAVRIRALEELS